MPLPRVGTAVRVRHVPGPTDDRREATTLATAVSVADTPLSRARGLMLRRLPSDGALVFPFDTARTRSVHTLFVPAPIDVVWTVGDEVVRVETMRAWADVARATCDRFVELPAGAASAVEPGDVVTVTTADSAAPVD